MYKIFATSFQFDGVGMMEFEEQERREIIARDKEDMTRHIASDIGAPVRFLRAFNRITFNTRTEDLVDSRTQDVYALIADHVHELEEEQ